MKPYGETMKRTFALATALAGSLLLHGSTSEIKVSFWSDDEAWELVSEEEYMNDNTLDLGMSM